MYSINADIYGHDQDVGSDDAVGRVRCDQIFDDAPYSSGRHPCGLPHKIPSRCIASCISQRTQCVSKLRSRGRCLRKGPRHKRHPISKVMRGIADNVVLHSHMLDERAGNAMRWYSREMTFGTRAEQFGAR
jgi:hypothetical protein